VLAVQVTRHPDGQCPASEEERCGTAADWYENIRSIAGKFGVKLMGSWDDPSAQKIYALYEAPSMDNLAVMMMDPAASGPPALCTGKVFPVLDHQTIMKTIKR